MLLGRSIILVVIILKQLVTVLHAGAQEHRLLEDLMKDYNPLERPVENETLPLKVTLQISLQQIIDVDCKNQQMTVNVWQQYAWKDYKLKWNPAEYNGVTSLRFPDGKIWKPDVLLYNSINDNFDNKYPSNQIVDNDGNVAWLPPGVLKSSCSIDITWFPFDDQSCYLKFGSWTYSAFWIDFQSDGMDTSEYLESGEWRLIGTPVVAKEKLYDCCPTEPYPSLFFYIKMRRRTLFYAFNLLIPSILISLMTVLGFTLPPDAGEKITLEITILLSVCFFLTMVKDMTPPTSDAVPLIGAYFSCCMLVVSASVVFTVVVLNIHYRSPDTHEMSPVMRVVLLNWLPWILMMKRPGKVFSRRAIKDQIRQEKAEMALDDIETKDNLMLRNKKYLSRESTRSSFAETSFNNGGYAMQPLSQPPLRVQTTIQPQFPKVHQRMKHRSMDENRRATVENCVECFFANPNNREPERAQATLLLLCHSELKKISCEMAVVTRRMAEEDADEEAQNDWKYAAMVIDRLCLFVFSVLVVFSTCGIIFSAPNMLDHTM